jgi:hypothetical protein
MGTRVARTGGARGAGLPDRRRSSVRHCPERCIQPIGGTLRGTALGTARGTGGCWLA